MALMNSFLRSKEAKVHDPGNLAAPLWEAVEKLEKNT
jgi:hypothetical protein